MIVDVHCHATTPPPQLPAYRAALLGQQARPHRVAPAIDDDAVRTSVERHRAIMRERGISHALFSPRAGSMGHELGDHRISAYWTEACNDLVARVRDLFPTEFSAVCQLPQSVDSEPASWLAELRRCVRDHGFVGCNVNPDISGGIAPLTPSIGDRWWYPLWEALAELDIPAMLHASQTRNPALHMNGTHYINIDYSCVVELCSSAVLDDFPTLKLIVPHGGGAAPFQLARLRALAEKESWGDLDGRFGQLYFDTAVYDPDALSLLTRKVDSTRLLYASEMMGTGMAVDPATGRAFDDNVDMVRTALGTDPSTSEAVLHGNAERIFRLAQESAPGGSHA